MSTSFVAPFLVCRLVVLASADSFFRHEKRLPGLEVSATGMLQSVVDKSGDFELLSIGDQGGPPEPKANLDTSFEIAIAHANGLNCSYVALFGTALGIHRDGGPVDQDDDIDFAVPYEDLEKVKMSFNDDHPQPAGDCQHNGFFTRETPDRSLISFWGYTLSEKDDEYLCFGCETTCTPTTACHWRDAYPKTMILPAQPKLTNVKGLTAQMPNEVEKWLTLRYGEAWNTPEAGRKVVLAEGHARYDAHC